MPATVPRRSRSSAPRSRGSRSSPAVPSSSSASFFSPSVVDARLPRRPPYPSAPSPAPRLRSADEARPHLAGNLREVHRVVVGGISGCGKSTLARTLSRRLALPYVDFDALFHGPAWTVRPTFVADVDAFVATDRWVTDSDGYQQYVGLRVLARADTYVWLDYSRPVVMRRVVGRTVGRIVTRERLFNG